MVNHQTSRNIDDELSRPGHTCLLVRSSGDNYKSVTLHCLGDVSAADYYSNEDVGDCGWLGPNIRPGRWQEKHVEDAWAAHLGYVAEHGPIRHGVWGNSPDVCRCYSCRNGLPTRSAIVAAIDAGNRTAEALTAALSANPDVLYRALKDLVVFGLLRPEMTGGVNEYVVTDKGREAK